MTRAMTEMERALKICREYRADCQRMSEACKEGHHKLVWTCAANAAREIEERIKEAAR